MSHSSHAFDDVLSTAEREEQSGRFAIDRSRALRPSARLGADAIDEFSLDELGVVELPLSADRVPPRPSFAASPSLAQAPAYDPDLRDFSVTVPPPAEERTYERAELQVDDLSLRLDNPWAASSLVPPPPKQGHKGGVLALVGALLLVGGGAYWLGLQAPEARAAHASVDAPRPVAAAVPTTPTAPAEPAVRLDDAEQVVAASAESSETSVAEPVELAKAVAPTAAVVEAPALARSTRAEPKLEADSVPVAAPAAVAVATAAAVAPSTEAPSMEAPSEAPAAAVAPAATETQPAESGVGELSAAAIELPEVPTREQIIAGFESVQPELATCAAGRQGLAKVTATILSSGRLSRALVEGDFAGTPEGSCMARALRRVSFAPFTQASLVVSYPIAL